MHFAWLLPAVALAVALSHPGYSQCASDDAHSKTDTTTANVEIQQRYDEKNWAEVVRQVEALPARTADVNFAYGMALAHLQRWTEARTALLAGEHQCPQQKRFAEELAGVAFELKHYPESARWLRKALRLDPGDQYANSFAGTAYLLMGNMNAALKYWNRVQKPYVGTLQFDPQLRLQRLILDRAFAFSPAAMLNEPDYETTRARLDALGIYPAYNIALSARSDEKFDVEFHATERNGFGSSPLDMIISTFSGAAYETVYPSYFNIGGTATNVESLLRWDSQKRRAWVSISSPLRDLPQWRGTLQLDARNENWAIRDSFTGVAPVLGSFTLDRQSLTAYFTGIPTGRVQWTAGAEVSNRRFHNVVQGTALSPEMVAPGFALEALGSIQSKMLEIPEHRFTITAKGSAELARLWPSQTQLANEPHVFSKLQGGATAHWFPQADGDAYEVQQRVRAGKLFKAAPLDELYLIGMERDTDLWLRGHVGTRDGRKGSSPLASDFFLANSDFLRRIYSNGLISIKAGPLFDVAHISSPTGGFVPEQWLFDTGMQIRLTALGTSVVFTWGHDLRSGNNAFYGAAAQR